MIMGPVWLMSPAPAPSSPAASVAVFGKEIAALLGEQDHANARQFWLVLLCLRWLCGLALRRNVRIVGVRVYVCVCGCVCVHRT